MASAVMAIDGPSCGYCMQLLKEMNDPRELPCGHIFCLECLQSDYSAGAETICAPCKAKHEGLDLNELPEVENSEEADNESRKLPKVKCSRNCLVTAMCFCLQCSSPMCAEHKKGHDTFLTNHTYVPFDEYRRLPQKYEIQVCTVHGSNLTLACEECDVLVCQECDLTSNCGRSGNRHRFQSLAKAEKKFTNNYRELIGDVSEQHSTFTKKQKDTEAKFEDLVVNYNLDEKLKEVDRVAEQQIAEIRRRADMKKREIKQFPNSMDVEVTEYCEKLSEKEQQLDELHKSLSRQMRELHITDVIRNNRNNRKKIADARELTTGHCSILRQMVAAPTGVVPDIGIQLRPLLPTRLIKFYNSSSVGTKAQLLTVTDGGELLYCYYGEVKLVDTHFKKVKFCHKITNVVSLAQKYDQVFIVTYANNYLKCVRMSTDPKVKEEVVIFNFRTDNPSPNKAQIIVKEDEVIAIQNSSYSFFLRIFNFSGADLRTVTLAENTAQICNLPGSFVLLQNSNQCLGKYDIGSSSPAATWQSKNTEGLISTDSVGLCYCIRGAYNAAQQMSFYWTDSSGAKLEQSVALEERRYIRIMDVNNNILSVVDDNGYFHLYYIEF